MTSVRTRSHSSRQRGLSIIEFMVGVAIGLLIVGGATKLMVDNLASNRVLLLETRVNQDLRAAADIIARDLRRAGYWESATSGVWGTGATSVTANSYSAWGAASTTSTSTSVNYAYARDTNNAVDNNEKVGFQLATVSGVGVLQIQDGLDSGWQSLTDPTTVDITGFSVTMTPQSRDLSSYCNCLKTLTCTLTSIAATGNAPTLWIRQYEFQLDGKSVVNDSIKRTIKETVRVRNDQLTGTCPA
jgi:type IV pilus assembly protein PilW